MPPGPIFRSSMSSLRPTWSKQVYPTLGLVVKPVAPEIVFDRKLRTSVDSMIPHVGRTQLSAGLVAFIAEYWEMMRDVRQPLRMSHIVIRLQYGRRTMHKCQYYLEISLARSKRRKTRFARTRDV